MAIVQIKNIEKKYKKRKKEMVILKDINYSFETGKLYTGFKDIDGNIYHSDYKWGIILMPTTYTLGVTGEYQSMINMILERERRRKWKLGIIH